MNKEIAKTELSNWFPTYGLLTSQRILEKLHLFLTPEELLAAIKNSDSVYYQLLRIPLKNVYHGIIMQQVHDYQVYVQKLYVDYLLSGEAEKDENAQGANTRDDLESMRVHLTELNEQYAALELTHQALIAQSQASLIKLVAELQSSLERVLRQVKDVLKKEKIEKEDASIQQAIRAVMIHYDKIDAGVLASNSSYWDKIAALWSLELSKEVRESLGAAITSLSDPRNDVQQILSTFLEQTEEMGIKIRSFRRQFFDAILKVIELLNLLSDYHINVEQDLQNRENLHFDATLGGQ